jgi:hypothetical protein
MIIVNWFFDTWEFLQKTLFIKTGILIILLIYIFGNFRSLWKKKGFPTVIHRRLRRFGILFGIYLVIIFLFFVTKKYLLYPYDKLFFPLLCGILVLFILLLINQIYIFSGSRYVILTGIPISFFGSWVAFDLLVILGFGLVDDPGHSPAELIGGILFFILISSFFIGIKNLLKSFRGIK